MPIWGRLCALGIVCRHCTFSPNDPARCQAALGRPFSLSKSPQLELCLASGLCVSRAVVPCGALWCPVSLQAREPDTRETDTDTEAAEGGETDLGCC